MSIPRRKRAHEKEMIEAKMSLNMDFNCRECILLITVTVAVNRGWTATVSSGWNVDQILARPLAKEFA